MDITSRRMPANQYGWVIQIYADSTSRSPVVKDFLYALGLKPNYNQADMEPLFVLAHVANSWRILLQSTQDCYSKMEGCWTLGFPGER